MSRRNLVVALLSFVLFLLVVSPSITGISFHEWLGLAVFALFFAHFAMSGDMMFGAAKLAFRRQSWRKSGNLIIDCLILISLVVCMVSGLLISASVLPAFGVYVPMGYYFWDPVHAASAKVFLVCLILHFAGHCKVVVTLFSQVGKRDGRRGSH